MITFLTKEADIEAIKADILTALGRRNFEAEGLQSRLSWKVYHVEMALSRKSVEYDGVKRVQDRPSRVEIPLFQEFQKNVQGAHIEQNNQDLDRQWRIPDRGHSREQKEHERRIRSRISRVINAGMKGILAGQGGERRVSGLVGVRADAFGDEPAFPQVTIHVVAWLVRE